MTTSSKSAAPDSTMSFQQANKVLATPSVRRAYACDAITVGLHILNAQENRPYGSMLRALFTSIADDRISFCLFENKKRLAMMCYVFDEEVPESPLLRELDGARQLLPASDLSRKLQPLFDDILAKMERQVWNRVQF
jgi:hypothetical protein